MSYILIAEDDRDIMLLVRRKLEISGYTDIWSTGSGKAALEKALAAPPMLMVLDIMLPELDGLSICRTVKDTLGTDAPPIIISSAKGQWSDLQEGERAGADAYIVKPFAPRELMEKIVELIP